MTFNVRGSHHPDGENAWERRAALNVSVIERYGPDLIGFQELQDGNLRTYDARLPGYERALGPRYENRRPHARNAIYWNPRRLKLLDAGGFWLSETPEEFSRSWDAAHVRSANWARFRLLPDGPELLHLNTHLDHKSGAARARGAKLIVQRLAGGAPVVLTGDFNCEPGSITYQTFTEAGFVDVHLAAGNPPANTFHRFRGEHFQKKDREGRIDWILTRDDSGGSRWKAHSCAIIRDAEPPVYPSDHYPVAASLSLITR